MVITWNKRMRGIARSDRMISYYATSRKTCRWYIKDLNPSNGCGTLEQCIPFLKAYLQDIISKIFGYNNKNFIQVEQVQRPLRAKCPSQSSHIPVKLEKRISCHVCRVTEKNRRQTFLTCSSCTDCKDNKIGLGMRSGSKQLGSCQKLFDQMHFFYILVECITLFFLDTVV